MRDVIFKNSGIKIKKEANIVMFFIQSIRIEDQGLFIIIHTITKDYIEDIFWDYFSFNKFF